MKKLLLILLAVMLCFGLVACATTDEPTDPAENPDENQVATPENPVIRLYHYFSQRFRTAALFAEGI